MKFGFVSLSRLNVREAPRPALIISFSLKPQDSWRIHPVFLRCLRFVLSWFGLDALILDELFFINRELFVKAFCLAWNCVVKVERVKALQYDCEYRYKYLLYYGQAVLK